MDDKERLARTRFGIISLVRLGGAMLFAAGFLAAADAIGSIPAGVDYILIVIGLFGALIAPRLLARRWKTKAPDTPA